MMREKVTIHSRTSWWLFGTSMLDLSRHSKNQIGLISGF